MNWYIAGCDQRAIITPREKEYALQAIQLTASRKAKETIRTSTGWYVIDGKAYFLHANGAISSEGQTQQYRATLKENFQRYVLPDPPEGEKHIEAVRASLGLLEVGDLSVTIPIFGAVYRAPLGNVDFVGHSSGKTNSLKTAVAVVAQQHYGKDFDSKHPPANWTSTGNFNQARMHAGKDVFVLLDDFVPRGTHNDQKRQHMEFDRMVRAVADGAFRGRLDAKHSDDAVSRGPRGMVWSTGEVVPEGESCQSRLVNTPYRPAQSVDPDKLRHLQHDGANGLLSQAMSAYIRYLATHYPDPAQLFRTVQDRVEELRDSALRQTKGHLLRTPENLANIAVGVEFFLRFALDTGVITKAESQSIWDRMWKTLMALGEVQTQRQHEEDPVREALRLLKSADDAGQLRFGSLDSNDADLLKESELPRSSHDAENFIGWRKDPDSPWLCDPNRLWAIIQRLFRDQGRTIPKGKTDLLNEMENGGFITARDEDRALPTVKRQVGARAGRIRVIEIPVQSFDGVEPARPPRDDLIAEEGALAGTKSHSVPAQWDEVNIDN